MKVKTSCRKAVATHHGACYEAVRVATKHLKPAASLTTPKKAR